jgi:Tfp pilus assembly protein PilX
MQKGSVLILTIITVLILSIMVTGMLTIGTTEIKTTQNYVMKKKSFFHAVQGLETVIEQVRNSEDPTTIVVNKLASPPLDPTDATRKNYYTGNMASGVQNVSRFEEFNAPQLVGISIGTESGFVPVMYRVPIVAEVSQGAKNPAVTEIEAGVYTLMKNY